MKRDKNVGMDVHQSMTVVAVMNTEGKMGSSQGLFVELL